MAIVGLTPGTQIVPHREDATTIQGRFNIMPNRFVSEAFRIRHTAIEGDVVEMLLDRTYASEMLASPSHVTMTVLPLCAQRAGYIYLCHKLGLLYDPSGPEHAKIWPNWLELVYPRLLRDESVLKYSVRIAELSQLSASRYAWSITSRLNDVLCLNARGLAVVLNSNEANAV
jgi:hypothetical protein